MSKILELMEAAGYQVNEQGMCYGIAHVAIQSALRGKFDEYKVRLETINNKSGQINIKDKQDRNILGFFDAIVLYHNSFTNDLAKTDLEEIKNNFGKFYKNRQDASSGNAILNEDEGKEAISQGIYPVKKSIQVFNSGDEIGQFLTKDREGNSPYAISLGILDHRMAIVFNNNQWHFVSHDMVESTEGEKITDAFIAKVFQEFADSKGAVEVIRYQSRPTNEVEYILPIKEAMLNKYVLFLALQKGHADAVEKFIEGIKSLNLSTEDLKELLFSKKSNGTPGLFMALQNGHADAVEKFIEGIKSLNLSTEDLKELLFAKRSDGIPGLFMALQVGHADAVEKFIEGIKSLNLSTEDLKELLFAKRSNGTSGLFMALKNGHADTVEKFISGAGSLGLDKADLKDLLFSKESNGSPGLFMALKNGHADTVEKFISGAGSLGLDKADLKDLLFSKESNGSPGLFMALQNGHADAVEKFIEGIKSLNLSTEDLKELLFAKRSDGIPGLFIALQKGHADTVEKFISGAGSLGLDKADLKDLLFSKESNGSPGLFMALKNGHADTVEKFISGAGSLGLDKADLKDLLFAKRSNGSPGLFMALKNGHFKTVITYLSRLKDLEFTSNELKIIIPGHDKTLFSGLRECTNNEMNKLCNELEQNAQKQPESEPSLLMMNYSNKTQEQKLIQAAL
ncbi:hypothetical protein L3V83_13810 [Thiotrichales bacterium 19X7-9]|nr:hypothetical protein [Thiotrichales bacterium 19X7-9]